MTIKEKIENEFIGANWKGEVATNEILTKIVGYQSRMYDQCIDDGADGDETEDTYVMKACFDFHNCNIKVRIYYGDFTEEIGYVEVCGDDCRVECGKLKAIPHFHIPNLVNLEKEVMEFVKDNQGEKGFIDTDNCECDTIWAVAYNDGLNTGVEEMVIGVRVKNNDLQVCLDGCDVTNDCDWHSVMESDYIYFIHTIFSIAESIGEYV